MGIEMRNPDRGQYFPSVLLTQVDLVEGSRSSSRYLESMFQRSISDSCECCVGLGMKALTVPIACAPWQQPFLFPA